MLLIVLIMTGLAAGLPEKRTVQASEVERTIRAGEPAEFDNCIIIGDLNLSGLKIKHPVHFNDTVFQKTVDSRSTAFNRDAYFKSSDFNDDANFDHSAFNGNTYFGFSVFKGDANFGFSTFNGDADFGYSVFKGDADFMFSKFKGITLFYDAVFMKKLNLKMSEYNNLYLRWGKNNKLVYDDTAYQLLIENLKKLGFMEDADNCYYQFRVEQFLLRYWRDDPFMYVLDFGAWIFYGYGKKPLYPVEWSILFIALFAFYWRYAGIDSPLRFSLRAFLSGTKLFIDPPDIPDSFKPRLEDFVIAERVLGAFFSILFFLAIGATVIR